MVGGACARWLVGVWCARAPGLISVRGPGWLRVGDMMVAGVIPQTALRPLGLSGPSTRAWRQETVGSRPRCIGVMRGCARMNLFGQAGCSASCDQDGEVFVIVKAGISHAAAVQIDRVIEERAIAIGSRLHPL